MIYLVCAAVAIGRFYIEPRFNLPTTTGCYETFAHMLIGYLICSGRNDARKWYKKPQWFLMASISLLELFMYLYQKSAL